MEIIKFLLTKLFLLFASLFLPLDKKDRWKLKKIKGKEHLRNIATFAAALKAKGKISEQEESNLNTEFLQKFGAVENLDFRKMNRFLKEAKEKEIELRRIYRAIY